MSHRNNLIFALRLASLLKLFLSIFLIFHATWTTGRGVFVAIYILLDVYSVTLPYTFGADDLMIPASQLIITLIISLCGFVNHEIFPSIHPEVFVTVFCGVIAACFWQSVFVMAVAIVDGKELQEQEKKSKAAVLKI